MKTALLMAMLLFSGCVAATRERGATGLWDRAAVIHGPEVDRCETVTASQKKFQRNQAKCQEQVYVHKLAVTDPVCLEKNFGEDVSGCPARAAVVDLGSRQLLLEMREANPDSQWFGKEQQQICFEEGALVDMYLRDHGY